MYPRVHAQADPAKPAIVMAGSGEVVTYGELEARSNRLAQFFRDVGLKPGDGIAVLVENHPRFLEVAWAAQRSGLYYIPLSTRLKADEAAFVLNDCGARVLVTSATLAGTAGPLVEMTPAIDRRLMLDGVTGGHEAYEAVVEKHPDEPIADESEGADMLYSSGTTGRPKGVRPGLTGAPVPTPSALVGLVQQMYGMGAETVYLSPAPLYHAAPLRFSMAVHRLGGTVVVMERFDAEAALAAIEHHRVTHAQFVPTMFIRLLRLPEPVRRRFDRSSLRVVIHAAAPCPVAVKEQMIEWWGPIIHEYYAGTEGNGLCAISSTEWLQHRGSVGRALLGQLHILDENGRELPSGETGTVYFAGGPPFEYHNDPDKTASAHSEAGWSTLGDIGHLDDDGYLYLTDRRSHMIISGGVNIYPQEAENVLALHPAVADVAVFGITHDEWGEEVKAVVQPADPEAAGPPLVEELLAYCRSRLADYKCPRTIDFEPELPRDQAGKLFKRELQARYQTRGRG